jgi:hypothetical protein
VSKPHRKQNQHNYERDEKEVSHYYKVQKTLQNKKLMKNVDKTLRSKDYAKIIQLEDY